MLSQTMFFSMDMADFFWQRGLNVPPRKATASESTLKSRSIKSVLILFLRIMSKDIFVVPQMQIIYPLFDQGKEEDV